MTSKLLLLWLCLLVHVWKGHAAISGPVARGKCLCITHNGANYRSSACGTLLGQLKKYQCFKHTGHRKGCFLGRTFYTYYGLYYNGRTIYVAGTLLDLKPDWHCGTSSSSEGCYCMVHSVGSVRASPCGTRIGYAKKYECYKHTGHKKRCYIHGRYYTYYSVAYNGRTGYIASPHLVFKPNYCGCYCVVDSVGNVRKSACGDVTGKVYKNQCFNHTGLKEGCYRDGKYYTYYSMDYYGPISYVAKSHLAAKSSSYCNSKPKGECYCVTGNVVYVRISACGYVIDKVYKDQCFNHTGHTRGCHLNGKYYTYYSFDYYGLTGYVAGSYLTPKSSSYCNYKPTGGCYCVTGNFVNVRDKACGDVIGVVRRNQCFFHTGHKEGCKLNFGKYYVYYSLNYNGRTGYVAGAYLGVARSSTHCRIIGGPR